MEIRPYQLSQIAFDDFTLAGYSVAGEETVLLAPELNVCFDIGKCPREALGMDNVLLTHSHADHSAGLLYYFAQRDFQAIPDGKIIMPAHMVESAEELIRAWGRFEGHVPPYRLIGIRPGEDYELRRGLVARPFAVRHTPGAVGYSVIDVRFKLKEEFIGLSGPEIVALKEKGVEITNRIEVPLVAYLGDTAAANFSDIPCVRDAKVLLIECTFFDADHVRRAKAGRHLYVDQLPELLEGMNNQSVVITHVTRRTNLGYARKMLRKALSPAMLEKVTFLMSRKHMEVAEPDSGE